MRKVKFENYLNRQLELYLTQYKNSSKRRTFLLEKSRHDERLAELVNAYFLSKGEYELANEVNAYNSLKFKTFDEMKTMNFKWFYMYKKELEAKEEAKNFYRKRLLELKVKNRFSYYKLSSVAKTNQSNLKLFFDGDNTKMSENKLRRLQRVLRRNLLLQNR